MIIESLLSLMTATLLFCGILSISYYALAREYVRFVGQEALYCMLEVDSARQCEHEAQARLSLALQASGDSWVQLSGDGRRRKIARVSFRPYKTSQLKEYLEQTLSVKGVLHAAKK